MTFSFSQYINVGYTTAIDRVGEAIQMHLRNLSFKLQMFSKVVLFIDTQAVIKIIASNQMIDDRAIYECCKLIVLPRNSNKKIHTLIMNILTYKHNRR